MPSFLFVLALLCCANFLFSNSPHTGIYFTENKGQIKNQEGKLRNDIFFVGKDKNLNLFLKLNGYSYQIDEVTEWEKAISFDDKEMISVPKTSSYHRIDINWIGNSCPTISKTKSLPGLSNFYLSEDPVTNVQSYEEINYFNLYTNIHLKWLVKNNVYKYEYHVAAGGRPNEIQFSIAGAKEIYIDKKGNLVIETSLGKIIEDAPYAYQGNKEIECKWKINNGIISYEIGDYDKSKALVIDPGVRIWGTYYGGNGGDSGLNSCFDLNGNVFMAGTTSSAIGTAIATSGSHQGTYGGGQDNAYLVKFNNAGVRQWATYYGGPVREFGLNLTVDNNGNSYIIGHSLGSAGSIIGTPGTHQPAFAGIWDAYAAKFNSNGIRQWGTFYGTADFEHGNAVAVDASGNVYICGKTDAATTTQIATGSSHQSSFGGVEDAFLVKLNSSGVRQWGTYFGGTGADAGRGLCVDSQNNVYMTGWTDNSVPNVIGSPGCHQNTFGGGSLDAFLVKFDGNGNRLWGTQYGGSGTDMAYDCETDVNLNVYMVGKTSSTQSISTTGSHQPNFGGGPQDAFIVSFDSNGARNWGSYYGGNGDEEGWGCSVHKTGHIYIAGVTSTNGGTAIATPGSHQPVFGGGANDGFIAQFEPNGTRVWGSYYGETGGDIIYGCSSDNAYHVSIAGSTDTNSGNAIASPGSHQSTYASGFGDGFLALFYDCPAPVLPVSNTPSANLSFCEGQTTTLSVASTASVNWYSSPTSTVVLNSGTVYTTPVLSAGTHTYYAESVSCTVSISRTPITVTVFAKPNLNPVAIPTLVCAGKNATLQVNGAASYTWNPSSSNSTVIVVSPASTSIYSISGTSTAGCISSQTVEVIVYPLDPVTITASSYTACLTITGGGPITLFGTPAGGTFLGSNIAGNQLNPTALGIFKPVYSYTNSSNGCVNSDTTQIEVFNCTSLIELENNIESIFPNPANNFVTINFTNKKLRTAEIVEISGKLVYQTTISSLSHEIPLKNFSPGIYVLKITEGDKTRHFKLVKN